MKSIKKMARVWLALMAVLIVMTACGSKGDKVVYEDEKTGGRVEITHKGDEVQSIDMTMEEDLEKMGGAGGKEMAKLAIEMVKEQLKSVKGITIDADVTDDKVKMKLSITDIQNIDLKGLEDTGMVGAIPTDEIKSLEKLEKSLQDSGMKKK